ncbi:MAG: hypothetical protein AB1344_08045 [Pseudomonadota bacterium]
MNVKHLALPLLFLGTPLLPGCAVVTTTASVAGTVVSTAVDVTATVAGTAVDMVTPDGEKTE